VALLGRRRVPSASGLSDAPLVDTGDPAVYASGVRLGLAGFAVCSLTTGLAFSWPLYLLFGLSAASSGELERG
jgi:hypothetical protein